MFIFAKLLRAVKQKLSSSTVPFVHCTDRALTAVLEEAVRELTALRGTVGPLRWARRFLQGAKVIALGIIHWRRPPSKTSDLPCVSNAGAEPVRATVPPNDLNLVLLNADCDVHFPFLAEEW
jgi:hypothetical protein